MSAKENMFCRGCDNNNVSTRDYIFVRDLTTKSAKNMKFWTGFDNSNVSEFFLLSPDQTSPGINVFRLSVKSNI